MVASGHAAKLDDPLARLSSLYLPSPNPAGSGGGVGGGGGGGGRGLGGAVRTATLESAMALQQAEFSSKP